MYVINSSKELREEYYHILH